MSSHNKCAKPSVDCPAANRLRAWLEAGATGRLTLTAEDFNGGEFSLTCLLFSGPPRERLRQRWRSFCSYMGQFTPFTGWKEFWYRKAGVSIGKNVYFSPGVVLDLLFPQLITLEEDAVLGMEAMIMAHVYTPDKIVLARAVVKRKGLVGGRAILGITTVGEEGVLGASSYTVKPVPPGHIAIGIPAVSRKRRSVAAKETGHDNGA